VFNKIDQISIEEVDRLAREPHSVVVRSVIVDVVCINNLCIYHLASEADTCHPPAWSVGSCHYYVNSLSFAVWIFVSCCELCCLQPDLHWPWLVWKQFTDH